MKLSLRLKGTSDPLAVLGGADLKILRHAETERSMFVGLGLVMISTAAVAMLSMIFAITNALQAPWLIAIPLGFGWGLVILSLDRLLVKTMHGVRGIQAIWLGIPRLILAAVIGVVVATPMTLQIFAPEISAQVAIDNVARAAELGDKVKDSPQQKRLDQVSEEIIKLEKIAKGDVPGISSPEFSAATEDLKKANDSLEKAKAEELRTKRKMTCELEGIDCEGTSQKSGAGPLYRIAKDEHDKAAAALKEAESAVTESTARVEETRKKVIADNTETVAKARKDAEDRLPQLREEQSALESALKNMRDPKRQGANTGMLAQLSALSNLTKANAMGAATHWAVALMFFMIELLPVLVKTMMAFGPEPQYDRVVRLIRDTEFAKAQASSGDERSRVEYAAIKRAALEDDMRQRELDLGRKSNARVASEMERILDLALNEWSSRVQSNLHNSPQTPVSYPPINQAQLNQNPGYLMPPTPAAAARFNLPDGAKL